MTITIYVIDYIVFVDLDNWLVVLDQSKSVRGYHLACDSYGDDKHALNIEETECCVITL